MQVKDIMTKEVITVDPETRIDEVAHILTRNKIHGVPVVTDGKLVGIIVENDFFVNSQDDFHLPSYIDFIRKSGNIESASKEQREQIDKLLNVRAKDIMTAECLCFSPNMEISEVMKIFKETKINTFPVVDENKNVVGIVALADVLNLIS